MTAKRKPGRPAKTPEPCLVSSHSGTVECADLVDAKAHAEAELARGARQVRIRDGDRRRWLMPVRINGAVTWRRAS